MRESHVMRLIGGYLMAAGLVAGALAAYHGVSNLAALLTLGLGAITWIGGDHYDRA